MSWVCKYCGFSAPTETACCYASWEEAANAKMGSFWFIGSAFAVAAVTGFIVWTLV